MSNLWNAMLRRSRRTRKRSIKKYVVIFFVVGVIMYWVFNQFLSSRNNSSTLISPISWTKNSPNKLLDKQKNSKSLQDAVEKALEGSKGTYGIVVDNLKTGESYSINDQKVYKVGSLYKLWIMAEALEQIQSGKLKEAEILSEDVAVLNNKFDIDSEFAEQTEGTITLSVNDALEQMITISHNYAALLLTEKIKLSNIAGFLKDNNFNQSKVGSDGEAPLSTPSDIALFYQKLYKGELADSVSTQKMLDLLKRQKLNDKLPQGLPDDIVIAHKTGELGSFTHDTGIVFSGKGDYIIVILSESDFPPGSEERISIISRAVYEYFERR